MLDLAAGTGKLSQALAQRTHTLFAVEPLAEMRGLLEQRAPAATALDGTAERIPLAEEAVDAVFVGEAFHWFNGARALPEIHRVLRPGGGLVLIWNRSKWHEQPWATQVVERLDKVPAPGIRPENRPWTEIWRRPLDELGLFAPLELREFPYVLSLEIEEFVLLIRSYSFVSARPPAEREQIGEDITHILRRQIGGGPLQFPYRTDVYVTWSLDSG